MKATNMIDYQPVIIIGAARSGTNMLRDVLTQLPGFGTWPCDEINYIWRYGNAQYPTDEFSPELATEPVKRYIRRAFARLSCARQVPYVVEKTCANSLRVAFVNQVVPEAKFIFIIRDGRDVVASALKRWSASLDLPYILKKARYVPLRDMPYYASRYVWNHIYRLFDREKQLAFWGPRFAGMDEMLCDHSLPEVCAAQWSRSVIRAAEDFKNIAPDRVHKIHYEAFVTQPLEELKHIETFLGASVPEAQLASAVSSVSDRSVGKWRQELSSDTLVTLEPWLRETLERHGYEWE
jgi:hypothetical protein